MRNIRPFLIFPLLLLTACGGGGGAGGSDSASAVAIESAFVPATEFDCARALEPCLPPSSSTTRDFGLLVRDVLDGKVLETIHFDEPGSKTEHFGQFVVVTEVADDGTARHAARALTSQTNYRTHQPQIEIHNGRVRFDMQDYPYHNTYAIWGDEVESRYYCIDYPYHCVVLHFPLGQPEPGSLSVLPAPFGTVGVEWYDLRPIAHSPTLSGDATVDEKRWSGWIGALTDGRDGARINRKHIDYIGILRVVAGDGSPVTLSERDWPAFGSAGCGVGLTLDVERRSVVFTDVFACTDIDLGSSLHIDLPVLNGTDETQRMRLEASRIESPMILPRLSYTATVRALDFDIGPLITVSDHWNEVHGAVFGADADAVVLSFTGRKSKMTITAQRRELVLGDGDLDQSIEDWFAALSDADNCDDCDD